SLSKCMQHFSSCYARYVNSKYKRIGHLFQGRFKAILIDAENYLTELIRYVHLNPVRAGLVKTPEDYHWSGHNAYAGKTKITWLTQDWMLNKFDVYETPARTLYREFVQRGIGESKRTEFSFGCRDGRFLGDDLFIEKVMEEMNFKSTKSTLISM